jgi:hypothetical protein
MGFVMFVMVVSPCVFLSPMPVQSYKEPHQQGGVSWTVSLCLEVVGPPG